MRLGLLVTGKFSTRQVEYLRDLYLYGSGLPLPAGRHGVTGVIVKIAERRTRYGKVMKALVDFGGWFAWGSLPRELRGLTVEGARIRMNATFKEEKGVAYYNRPGAVEVLG